MDLRPYVENIHEQLALAAEAGGEEARALADRLVAPLDAAIRLALQDVLAAAAEELTTELAPGSVELRLRGRNPELVVTMPPAEAPADDVPEGTVTHAAAEGDDGSMSRINLRMPENIKARIERAADSQGVSVNSWLLRAATAALDRGDLDQRRQPRTPASAQRYTGWAR
jgi:HicB family